MQPPCLSAHVVLSVPLESYHQVPASQLLRLVLNYNATQECPGKKSKRKRGGERTWETYMNTLSFAAARIAMILPSHLGLSYGF